MLDVLDTAGQEKYTAPRDQWIRGGDGFLIVYSSRSRSSFSRVQNFYDQIARVKSAPTMLVGNNCDQVAEREVSTREGADLAKRLRCPFVETSAKNCINVEQAFHAVVRMIRKQRSDRLDGVGKLRRWEAVRIPDSIDEIS
jgi:GTPase KRas protein